MCNFNHNRGSFISSYFVRVYKKTETVTYLQNQEKILILLTTNTA